MVQEFMINSLEGFPFNGIIQLMLKRRNYEEKLLTFYTN